MSGHPLHEERARRHRQRVTVRAFEQRQLHTSKGVWWRLARLLGYSAEVLAIDQATARVLEEAGHRPHPVGLSLAPARALYVVSAAVAGRLPAARPLEPRPTAAFLAESCVVLVPFEGDSIPDPPRFNP